MRCGTRKSSKMSSGRERIDVVQLAETMRM
jgi:hypothetical protein